MSPSEILDFANFEIDFKKENINIPTCRVSEPAFALLGAYRVHVSVNSCLVVMKGISHSKPRSLSLHSCKLDVKETKSPSLLLVKPNLICH